MFALNARSLLSLSTAAVAILPLSGEAGTAATQIYAAARSPRPLRDTREVLKKERAFGVPMSDHAWPENLKSRGKLKEVMQR